MENLQKLLSEVKRYVDKDKQIKKEKYKRGEAFNVFNVLGLSCNETRTHSAFIAELLNPKGSHGCGDTFLSEFIKTTEIKPKNKKDFNEKELENAKVKVELSIGTTNKANTEGGRIDIIIYIGKYCIIIENKIYAEDQEKQLLRYSNYAKAQKEKKAITGYKLFYLTLFGDEASECSTANELKCNKDYITLSYSNDIIEWLKVCKEKAVEKPLVRETIIQYINLIKELTNTDMEDEQKKQMLEKMAEYPESVAQILCLFPDFRNYMFEQFCIPQFKQKAESLGLKFDEEYGECGDKCHSWGFYKEGWKYSIIEFRSDHHDKKYYYGISLREERKIKQRQMLKYKPNSWWPYGSQGLEKYRDWRDDDSVFTAFKTGEFSDYIMDVLKEVLRIIEENNLRMI